ncbi:MAG: RDD family protein [Bacteriovoracaceae bacterium]|nr:RDD family protein [Bacteriovoracaceae bacterium]
MKRKYILKSPVKTAKFARLIAKAIDLFIVMFLSVFLYPLGIILGLIYIGVCDSLRGGQSVGKKFIGFAVISLEDGSPCSLKQSIKRNLPFIVPIAFTIIPILGWIFAFILGIILISVELILLFKLDSGHRLGDVMADTSVVTSDKARVDTGRAKSWFKSSEEDGSTV